MGATEKVVKVQYEELVALIVQALRDDAWLGHTDELEEWHLEAIARTVAQRLVKTGSSHA